MEDTDPNWFANTRKLALSLGAHVDMHKTGRAPLLVYCTSGSHLVTGLRIGNQVEEMVILGDVQDLCPKRQCVWMNQT